MHISFPFDIGYSKHKVLHKLILPPLHFLLFYITMFAARCLSCLLAVIFLIKKRYEVLFALIFRASRYWSHSLSYAAVAKVM